MKRIVIRIILCMLIFIPIFANAQNEKNEALFVENEEGVYVNKKELKMNPESYYEARPYVKGYNWHKLLVSTMTQLFSKERSAELKDYAVRLVFHFNAVRKKLAYISFEFIDKQGHISEKLLTDAEMQAIETAFKSKKWDFSTFSNTPSTVPYFTESTNVFNFKFLERQTNIE